MSRCYRCLAFFICLFTLSTLTPAFLASGATAAPAKAPAAVSPPKASPAPPLVGASSGEAHFALTSSPAGAAGLLAQSSIGRATFTPNPGSDMKNPPTVNTPTQTAQGPVMTNPVIYNVFWLPANQHFETAATAATDTKYENLMNQYATDIGGNDYYNINTQYPGSNGTPANSVAFGGSTTDTTAYPGGRGTSANPLLESDVSAAVTRAEAANSGWGTDINHIYMVYTAKGIEECDGTAHNFCTPGTTAVKGNFCAYHQFTTPPHAYMPSTCATRAPSPSPNGDREADSVIEIFGHELFEAVTDPLGSGWQGPAGTSAEIGDLCNAQNGFTNFEGANTYLNGHGYTSELEWSNAIHGCAMDLKSGSVVPPSISISKSVDNPTPDVGDTINYTIKMSNASNTGPATNLVFTDTLPSGYTVTGLNAPGATSQSNTSGSVTVNYDNLPVHDNRTITISATVPNQPLKTAINCGGLSFQDAVTAAQTPLTTSPCAQTTPKDQHISLTPLAAAGTEGSSTIALATLTDPDPNATATEYKATIDWGDGSPTTTGTISGPTNGPWTVTGTHLYLEEGTYTAKVSVADVTDDVSNTASTNVTVTVADAALTAGPAMTLPAVEGAPFSGVVATFTDADPNGTVSDYTAMINWGDGTPATLGTVAASGGGFTVSGSHTFLEEGSFPASVSVSDVGTAATTASATFSVADAALSGTGISFTSANPVTNATVATFTDADPNGTVSDYTAMINWGDGTPATAGTVSASGGGFAVSGSHTYVGTGPFTFTVKVHICDVGGSCTDTVGTLKITYMTGRSYGLASSIGTPIGTFTILPFPDTGSIASSLATTAAPPCALSLTTLLVQTQALCAKVTISTGPGASSARATLTHASIIGILGVPAIDVTGVQAASDSTCGGAAGSTTITRLVIGGKAITVTGGANVTIALPGLLGAKLVINEQKLTTGPGGDRVLTVNAIHIIVGGPAATSADVVVASATSDIHNCP